MKSRLALAIAVTLAIGQLSLVRAADRTTSEETATRYLLEHRDAYDVDAADLSALRATAATRSRHNGVEHVYLRQTHDGLDVITGDATVSMRPDGEVLHVGSRLLRDIDARATGAVRLDAIDAVRAAAGHLGLRPDRTLRTLRVDAGAERATLLSAGGISNQQIPTRLVYEPSGDALRIAWELDLDTGHNWWNFAVDAETGDILSQHDYVVHESIEHIAHATARPSGGTHDDLPLAQPGFDGVEDGSAYNVYAWPLESPNDGDRSIVSNPAHPDASPFGWHDTDGVAGPEFTSTRGNNVHAFADFTSANRETLPTNSSDGGLTFDHPLDLTLPPPAYRDAAVTNLFYWNNVVHDVFDGYGFDEISGNFQEVNYDEEGLGSDSVQANAQDLGPSIGLGVPPVLPPIDNANFATPNEGQNPRMQMYLWAATPKRELRDGDLDAGIVIHEYGHGISIRLTGGPFNVECLGNEEQAGEGWSDFFAIALTARSADEALQKRGLATYVSGQDARTGGGIRPTPYWTINPTPRYDHIKSAFVPHGVGWVWASMLWDLYWMLVEEHGFNPDVYGDWTTGGNNRAIQLVVDGLKMQSCLPGFVDSRNAILAADQALTGGADRCTIWAAFARRGLGFSAHQGSSQSVTDGTQAFDLPPDCA